MHYITVHLFMRGGGVINTINKLYWRLCQMKTIGIANIQTFRLTIIVMGRYNYPVFVMWPSINNLKWPSDCMDKIYSWSCDQPWRSIFSLSCDHAHIFKRSSSGHVITMKIPVMTMCPPFKDSVLVMWPTNLWSCDHPSDVHW